MPDIAASTKTDTAAPTPSPIPPAGLFCTMSIILNSISVESTRTNETK